MSEFKERIDALAALMEEYRLTEAALEDGSFRVVFRRHGSSAVAPPSASPIETPTGFDEDVAVSETEPPPIAPMGTPVASPMNGIFYDAPSPASPPFVKEGDLVTAGQVIGLIEAMKVFSEIPSPVSGIVKRVVAESGAVVSIGDALILLG